MQKLYAVIVAALPALMPFSLQSQETNFCVPPPPTRLEVFEAKTGIVQVQGSALMGTIPLKAGVVSIRCREVREPSTGLRESGLVISVKENDQLEDTNVVDYDEIDSLLGGIDFISRADHSVSPLPHFEAIYRTRALLQVSTYSSKRTGTIESAIQSSRINRTTALLSLQDLARLRQLIEQSKAKLDALRK
jgi:hypothetical protein